MVWVTWMAKERPSFSVCLDGPLLPWSSSKDMAGLLSFLVLSNTFSPSSYFACTPLVAWFNAWGKTTDLCSPPWHNFSITLIWLWHGVRSDGRPLSRMLVLKTLTIGLWALSMQTSPSITQPKSNLCAKGALWGPLICCRTLFTRIMSLPSNTKIWASRSRFWINCATEFKCGWAKVTSGVGVSDLLLIISLHSISGGITRHVLPSRASTWKPTTFLPVVFMEPAHVLNKYGEGLLWIPKSQKNSLLANERLLWSSIMAYILIARSRCSRGKTRTKHIFAQDRIGAPSPQTSVHFEVTSGVVKSFWSVPGSYI